MTTKLHELLAAENTAKTAWNSIHSETLKKLANTHYFDGHSQSLTMIEETPANRDIEAQGREEKPVITSVFETLKDAFEIFERSEDLQYQKNATNRKATGTVLWKGQPLLAELPVDELLGLEARLTKIRELFAVMPTLDAAKHWRPAPTISPHVWELVYPEEKTKTEKRMFPVVLYEATKEHPANVQAHSKDEVVGKVTTLRRSGAVTALQKFEALKRVDELLMEIKQARMRANETEVDKAKIASTLIVLLLEPLAAPQ